MTFLNVTLTDSKVIQCNVTNNIGYVFTNAYMNVYGQLLYLLVLIILTAMLSYRNAAVCILRL